jgi:hypothetical protein
LGKKDPKLNEVKAVLQRLQGFPEQEPVATTQPAAGGVRAPRMGMVLVGAISLAGAAAMLGMVVLLNSHGAETKQGGETKPSIPVGSAAPARPAQPDAVKATLDTARELMMTGQVQAARQQLLAPASRGSPDAAWDLARSYDPNVLVKIEKADAAADVAEATRWYRAWYSAAVKEGMVADSVSLERIIGSMKK